MKDFDEFWDEYCNITEDKSLQLLDSVLKSLDIESDENGKFTLDMTTVPTFCILYSKALTKEILRNYHNWLKDQL